MQVITFLFAAVLALASFVSVQSECPKVCTRIYKPVCAELKRFGPDPKCTFANECVLRSRMCHYRNEKWTRLYDSECNRQSMFCGQLTQ